MQCSIQKWLPLAEAAMRLGLPYQDTHRLMLLGQLGSQRRGSRWYVSAASVERLRARREADHAAVA
jgi:hypothetical protein